MKWKDHVQSFSRGSSTAITARVSRLLLLTFVVTFLTTRIIVFMIAERWVPNLFLFVGDTHVHHLNYGISLLSLVGLNLLMFRPSGKGLYLATIGYGLGLALTFDEFGMWLFLGGSYNNHLTFDAIVVIAALLALISLATTVEKYHPRHWVLAALVVLLLAMGIALAVVVHQQGVMDRVFTVKGL